MPRVLVLTLIAVHALAVIAVAVAVGWTHSKPWPNRATFERVQMGMTQAEVYAAVGCPPGSYRSAKPIFPTPRSGGYDTAEDSWSTDNEILYVWYSNAGVVQSVDIRRCDCIVIPSREQQLWSWLTTGYAEPSWGTRVRKTTGQYDLGTLRNILSS